MTRTSLDVLPDLLPCDSIRWTTSSPSTTAPKTTCLPSSQSVLEVQMKNCEPLVPGPALACGDEIMTRVGCGERVGSRVAWIRVRHPEAAGK